MLRVFAFVVALFSFSAQAMEPVEVAPVKFARASLIIEGVDGPASYDPKALEAYGTYAMTTVTPWRPDAAEFVGIRLNDLLAKHGLDAVDAIRVIAENDYAITIPNQVWSDNDVLVATRVNGRGHSRRARGPIQFIYNMSKDPSVGVETFQKNWVWMAARIEVAEPD
ncbi:MAG: hypothetical protein AAF479_07850 [Pseudomonadota bacterium]